MAAEAEGADGQNYEFKSYVNSYEIFTFGIDACTNRCMCNLANADNLSTNEYEYVYAQLTAVEHRARTHFMSYSSET